MEKGYKVVLRDRRDGSLVSSYVRGHGLVTYRPGVAVTPGVNCGPLCVFATLDDAQNYICVLGSGYVDTPLKIWECEYIPSDTCVVWCGHELVQTPLVELFSGCVLADSVTLTKRVF